MFERFTRQARAVVTDAQIVARGLHSPAIDSRHVVIALAETDGSAARALRSTGLTPGTIASAVRREIAGDGGLDSEALASLGIDLEAVRVTTDATFGDGAFDAAARRSGPKGHIPFTRDAKKSLELALREAVRLRSKDIDETHLLLGILRDGHAPGAKALSDAGVDVPALRAALESPA
ncbi:Clp protease N-terminal domain-containing protein [Myceligenerans halotolerans]